MADDSGFYDVQINAIIGEGVFQRLAHGGDEPVGKKDSGKGADQGGGDQAAENLPFSELLGVIVGSSGTIKFTHEALIKISFFMFPPLSCAWR